MARKSNRKRKYPFRTTPVELILIAVSIFFSVIFWSTLQHGYREFNALESGKLVVAEVTSMGTCKSKHKKLTRTVNVSYQRREYSLSVPSRCCSKVSKEGPMINVMYSQRYDYIAYPLNRSTRFQVVISVLGLLYVLVYIARKLPRLFLDMRQLTRLNILLLVLSVLCWFGGLAQSSELTFSPPTGFYYVDSDAEKKRVIYHDAKEAVVALDITPDVNDFEQGKLKVLMSLLVLKESLDNLELVHKDLLELDSGLFLFLIYTYRLSDFDYCVYSYHTFYEMSLVNVSLVCGLEEAEGYKNQFLQSINSMVFMSKLEKN